MTNQCDFVLIRLFLNFLNECWEVILPHPLNISLLPILILSFRVQSRVVSAELITSEIT